MHWTRFCRWCPAPVAELPLPRDCLRAGLFGPAGPAQQESARITQLLPE
jgi:hypothetical protein